MSQCMGGGRMNPERRVGTRLQKARETRLRRSLGLTQGFLPKVSGKSAFPPGIENETQIPSLHNSGSQLRVSPGPPPHALNIQWYLET